MERVRRPCQLVLHVTQAGYDATEAQAKERGVSKSVVVRETLNKGLRYDRVLEALEDMCIQFAYTTSKDGSAALTTGGLSPLEEAFDLLGWDDPHLIPWDTCDEPGCDQRTSCGFPTPAGYRRTCGTHYAQAMSARQGQDRNGLGAKPASAVAESHAPAPSTPQTPTGDNV